jgi:hypothetical protein
LVGEAVTHTSTRIDYWIYSAETDSYRVLQPPAQLRNFNFAGMNNRLDITGLAWDDGRIVARFYRTEGPVGPHQLPLAILDHPADPSAGTPPEDRHGPGPRGFLDGR